MEACYTIAQSYITKHCVLSGLPLQSLVLYQLPLYYINPCIIATTLESRILLRTVWMNTLYAPYICTAMSKKIEVKGAFQPPTSY